MRLDSPMSTDNRFREIVCSPVDTHYTVVWTVSKNKKQKEEIEEKRLEYRKQERRLLGWCCVSPGCVGIYLLSGKRTFVPSPFLILSHYILYTISLFPSSSLFY
jgi:hypothetical protein